MEVEEIFENLQEQHGVSFDEFKALVEHKVDTLGGLCDYETAAKLVAHEMGVNPEVTFKDIGEITKEDEYASFVGKIVQIGDTHEFSREDGSVGRVANLHVADESGEIRLAVWDEVADMVKVGEVERGEVIRVENAQVREGYRGGVEVSVTGSTKLERDDSDIQIEESFVSIGNLEPGLGAVHVRGRVLDVGDIRTFQRKDGSNGRVASLRLGDETGKVGLSLWGKHADEVENFSIGDTAEVTYGYTRERYGNVELHLGNRGHIEKSDVQIDYDESFTPLDDVVGDGTYDVRGRVTAVDDIHTFQRKDGSEGKVANAHLEDPTGTIRCAFWDDKAEEIQDVLPGDTLILRDAKGRTGQDGTPELSAGWRTSFEAVREERDTYTGPIGDLPGGVQAEVTGSVVTWDGVLDDGTGCVATTGKPVPFGITVRVKGVTEERDGSLALKVTEGEPVEVSEEDVQELLDRLNGG